MGAGAAIALKGVTDTIGQIVRSKYFWIAVGVLLAIWLVRRYGNKIKAGIARTFKPDAGDYSAGFTDSSGTEVSGQAAEQRKRELKAMADAVFAEIQGGTWTTAQLEKLAALNDTELRYVAEQYALLSPAETLFDAIDNEWMPMTDLDDRLMARLARMALD